jgi:AraC-like DNA-binding protein
MNSMTQADALQRTPLLHGDRAKFWREPRYDGLECLAAEFRTHVYERHTHETFVIGSIISGCERFELAGVQYAARGGDLCFVHPDTVHDGRPEGDGYAYRMIYPSASLLASHAEELTGRPARGTLSFPEPVVHDPELCAAFVAAHEAMERRGADLAADEAMNAVMAHILVRHAKLVPPHSGRRLRERPGVTRARDYLDAHLTDNVDLQTLAAVAGLSRAYLIRAFKSETGLTPHAFMIDRRVRLARRMLLSGRPAVEVAAATGFADQAHMTRAFKARIGTTPGSFARMT